jgi:superfamily I DNA and/or RNA helicase
VPEQSLAKAVVALDGFLLDNHHLRVRPHSPAAHHLEQDHFRHLLRLMAQESTAEAAQLRRYREKFPGAEAERTGQSLVNLTVRDEFGGLGGRALVTLGKRNESEPLPWTRLGIGSPVVLTEDGQPQDPGKRGVVSLLHRDSIQVALADWLDAPAGTRFRIDLANDEVARQRERAALERASAARSDGLDSRLAHLRQVLLGETPPSFQPAETSAELRFFNEGLNPPQQEAVRFGLRANDLAIIHGPPGTGKTTTVIELIRHLLQQGQTVLACAPSNLAVDNLFERLLAAKEPVIRLGHPARVLPELRAHTLDALLENHPDVKMARKLSREAHRLRERANRPSRSQPTPSEKRQLRDEASQLLADARRIEAQTVERILDQAQVICATTTGLDSQILGQRRFDVCVLDEAAQSTEPGAWIPLTRSDRLILAGDHQQLPPTIISPEAASEGLALSLMERLLAEVSADISRLLTVQYRMNRQIMQFSSQMLYENALIAADSVAEHLLADLPGVTAAPLSDSPLRFIDTAGASYDEQLEPDGDSRFNPQEAELVQENAQALLDLGLPPSDLAVITPYSAQVRYLRQLLPPEVEVGSVDGFQGREKEAVIISLVRSNPEGEIGFLSEVRRMNVALTRARRKLIVIGDSATITTHPFYQALIAYFEQVGAYRSVWEALY